MQIIEPKQQSFVISTILPVFSAAMPNMTVPKAPERMTREQHSPASSSLYPTLVHKIFSIREGIFFCLSKA